MSLTSSACSSPPAIVQIVRPESVRFLPFDICNLSYLEKSENNHDIYKLPMLKVHENEYHHLRHYELGSVNPDKRMHEILLVGKLCSGKARLINHMVNYIYGISYQDRSRLQVVPDSDILDERTSPESPTLVKSEDWMISYTFHWLEGFRIPYSLCIIDVPGFGDLRGVIYDDECVNQIKHFFYNPLFCPKQTLSSIGLVMPETYTLRSKEEMDMLDYMLSIFGKDMINIVSVFLTSANHHRPPSPDVIEGNAVKFAVDRTFRIDTSEMYSCTGRRQKNTRSAWTHDFEALEHYFNDTLTTYQPVDVKLTKYVLKERDLHCGILRKLKSEIHLGLQLLQRISESGDKPTQGQKSELMNMIYRYQKHKLSIMEYIEESQAHLNDLDEITLRSSYLHSTEHFFDEILSNDTDFLKRENHQEYFLHLKHLTERLRLINEFVNESEMSYRLNLVSAYETYLPRLMD